MNNQVYVYQIITDISTFYEDLTISELNITDTTVRAYEEYIWEEYGQNLNTMTEYLVRTGKVKNNVFAGQVVTNDFLSKTEQDELFDIISSAVNDYAFYMTINHL